MTLFEIRGIKITFNPLLFLPIIYYALNDALGTVGLMFIVLALHEASHTLMAGMLGYKIESVELHPFGFEARLFEALRSAKDEFAISAAGPVYSIVTGLCCMALKDQGAFITEFARLNITLGILNFMPAYPLDGGRMLYSLLSMKTEPKTAKRICIALGIVLALVLALSAFILKPFNPSLAVFAFFIGLADIRELKKQNTAKISALLLGRTTLRKGEALKVRCIALHKSVTLARALCVLGTGFYTFVLVLDDDMKEIAVLSQEELMNNAASAEGSLEKIMLEEIKPCR